MKIKYTPVQEKIIYSKCPRILVSASAGTGKTTVMVKRVGELIRQGVPVTSMLILAFNRLAAAQMRTRLFEELSETEGEYAARAQKTLGIADISTLHSWAANLIRTYFYRSDISPAFRVMEEKESVYYMKQCLSAVIEEYYKSKDSDFEVLADVFSSGRSERVLKSVIKSIYDISEKCADPAEWLRDAALKGYKDKSVAEKILNEYLEDWRDWLIFEAAELHTRAQYAGYDNLADIMEDIIKYIRKDISPSFVLRAPLKASFDEKAMYVEAREFKKKVNAEFKKSEKYRLFPEETLSLPYAKKLIEVTAIFAERYAAKKRQLNALDYGDLEHGALKLLKDEHVAQLVREKYKYVFVDEYQDINEIQDTIIEAVCAENLFAVGDIKQSIYAFRLCEPDIFVAKKERYQSSSDCECYNLNDNFRSTGSILAFNNNVFCNIMTKKFGRVDYRTEGMFATGENNGGGTAVEVHINKSSQKENESKNGVYSVLEHDYSNSELVNAEKEAHIITERIAELLTTEFEDGGTRRVYTYGDIAVIFRSRGVYYEQLASQLAILNIPFVTDRKHDLINSRPVGMVLSLLKCINNMRDDYAFTGYLRSVFVGLNADELAAVRTAYKDELFFYEAIQKYADNISDLLGGRLKAVISDLRRYTALAGRMTVAELLDIIYTDTAVCDVVQCYSEGTGYRAELAMFRESMRGKIYGKTLPAYLSYIEDTDSLIIEPDSDCAGGKVRVMTAHSSKGLEFPVVIYGGAGAQFNRMDSRKPVQINKDCGLGINGYDSERRLISDNALRQAIIVQNEGLMSAEEMRILYVTLSRAKHTLIVVGTAKNTAVKNNHSFAVRRAANPLEWILRALKTGEYKTYEEFEDTKPPATGKLIFGKALEEYTDAINASLNYTYPYPKGQPAKTNVSALNAKEALSAEDNLERDYYIFGEDAADLSLSRIAADPTETGTAYHNIMQYIKTAGVSYNNIDSVDAELQRLVDIGKITERQRDIVVPEKILKCVNSVFCIAGKYYREQPFLLSVSGNTIDREYTTDTVLIQGIIDLLIIDGDTAIIVEYKTGNRHAKELVKAYSGQLELYSQAAEKILKKKVVKKIIYSFYSDEQIYT